MIHFYQDIEDMRRLVGDLNLADDIMGKATAMALNKTAKTVRAWMVQKVREDYNIPAGVVRKALYIKRAFYNAGTGDAQLEASIQGSGKHGIPMYLYSPRPKSAPSTKRTKAGQYTPKAGISVKIRKDSRKVVKGAFVAEMSSGHVGVFQRTGSGLGNWWKTSTASSIKEVFGPSPLRILDSEHYYEEFDNFTEETMDKNMAHEAAFYMQRAGIL